MKRQTSIRARQWLYIGGGAAAAISLLSALAMANATKPQASAEKPPSGVVALTQDQFDNLTFATAAPRGFQDEVIADGRVIEDGDHTVQVYSPFTGMVDKVLVEPGQRVRRGQALFSIHANEAAQNLSDLASDQATLISAKAQQKVALGALRRAQIALTDAGGAQKDVDAAQRDLTSADAAVAAAAAALRAQQDKQAILGLDSGGPNSLAYVRAASDGVVAGRLVAPGQRIVDASQAVMEITDTRSVWIDAQVAEEDSSRVAVGQTIGVHVDAAPGSVFSAKVVSVSPILDPDTHRLPVRATINNPGQILKPGMFATVYLDGPIKSTGLAIPSDAIIQDGPDARVWVVKPGRRAIMQRVSLGQSSNGYTEILSGLQPGDRIVKAGAIFVDKAGLG